VAKSLRELHELPVTILKGLGPQRAEALAELGIDTVLAQIAADRLDIAHDTIRVVRGRTDQFEYGRGAFATRLAVMAGSATSNAADALVAKAKRVAAAHLRVSVEEVDVSGGAIVVATRPSDALSLAEIAALLEPVGADDLKEAPGLVADGWFRTDHMTYPYGVHAAVVSIDRATGAVCVERFIVGYDVGRALNPALVEGLARRAGVQTPSNLLFASAIAVLLLVCIQLSAEITTLEEETRTLAEEVALLRLDVDRALGSMGVVPLDAGTVEVQVLADPDSEADRDGE